MMARPLHRRLPKTGTPTRAWTLRLAVALLAQLLAACSHHSIPEAAAPVQVAGRGPDRRSLEGSWSGEFHSERTGRSGTIRFTLLPGQDTAYARVVIHGAAPAPACGDPVSQATAPPGNGELVLRLAWLGVDAGSVGGWLAPYQDPEAGCVMDVWFEGLAWRDRIAGSYFARSGNGDPVRIGSWEVRRQQ
jgi:hypothetical protein